jgi:hypothetical protein
MNYTHAGKTILLMVFCLGVIFTFLTIHCGGDESADSEQVLDVLDEAGDSIYTWSDNMSYEAAALLGLAWLQDQDIVESCGVSSDYTVWVQFTDSTGGDIYPPWEIAASFGSGKDPGPAILRSPAQTERAKAILYDAVVLLPFHWQYGSEMDHDDSLVDIITAEMDIDFEIYSHLDTAVTVDLMKSLLASRFGIFYICTHGSITANGHESFLIGEKVTLDNVLDNFEDLKQGNLRYGKVIKGGDLYYGITTSFIDTYLYKASLDPGLASFVYIASCNSNANGHMANAFLCDGIQTFLGFKGLLHVDPTVLCLFDEIFGTMYDTISLQQAVDNAEHRYQSSPACTLKMNEYTGFNNATIFNRVLCDIDGQEIHSPTWLTAVCSPSGSFSLDVFMYDIGQNQHGVLGIITDGYSEDAYTVEQGRGNLILYNDQATGRAYMADAIHMDPAWSGGAIEGTITYTNLDNPDYQVVGTFSGTLGYWDPANPNPHPPDDIITITDGVFKVVRQN